ncbi:DUF3455 domain-containing protein [Dyella telluris]|uniref:DUF3455 domain-containing protein n=1 Tax=Dyella telluris TaxID=2763498 RepID=A0A7G8Q5Y5_9GAMM|nr:DUF3455 domain-containing protein [Dyella telluris]QNK02193.1 DUF3455 domain-containing protein [Dyella telluris]
MNLTSTFGKRVAATCFLAGIAASHAQDATPATLQPPAGYKVAFTAKATGVQIYTSTAETGSAPKWTFEAPLAELRSASGVIHHYAGPSWEAADGSKVVRDKEAPVATVPARQASADIPWLLIKVSPDATPGILSKVVYVQRVETKGGVAPASAPTREGTKVGVPYTATYVFYVKSN